MCFCSIVTAGPNECLVISGKKHSEKIIKLLAIFDSENGAVDVMHFIPCHLLDLCIFIFQKQFLMSFHNKSDFQLFYLRVRTSV